MKHLALIPARGGSTGVNDKNITHLIKKEFLDKNQEGQFHLNFDKLKNHMNKKIKEYIIK